MKQVKQEFVFTKEEIETLYKHLSNITVTGPTSTMSLAAAMQIVLNSEAKATKIEQEE